MQYETKTTYRNLTVLRTLAVLLALFFTLNYGQPAAALETKKEIQKSAQQQAAGPSKADLSPLYVLQKMSQARKDGKYVFLLFYEKSNPDCDTMSKRLDEFIKQTKEKVEVIKIDRNEPSNSTIVASMRVQTAPLPLTLVEDFNGNTVKAFTKVVSVEELRQAIPSPKKQAAITFLKDGKSLILSFVNPKMALAGDVNGQCEAAAKKLNGKTEYIKVDISDPKEVGFIKELKIDPNTQEPVTLVVNSSKQTTGDFTGKVKADDLVLAATKVAAAGGCCGGGSGKSCGPAKQ